MQIALNLSEMSRAEKLRVMETLWTDLSKDDSLVQSPPWHAEKLKEAEALHKAGKAGFSDWEVAKERIRTRVQKQK